MEPITKIIEIAAARAKIQAKGKYPIGKKSQSEQILDTYKKRDNKDEHLHSIILELLQESWRADKKKAPNG